MHLVLYGSETGNSIDFADLVVDRFRRLGLEPQMMPFGDASFSLLQQADLAVIICSTTGQGALPINTRPFWGQLLRKNLGSATFDGLKIATFGLGDSSYPRYNWAIKKIHNRLVQLGAEQFVTRGEVDEQDPDGIEFVFGQWLDLLLAAIKTKEPPKPIEELLPPRFTFSVGPVDASETGPALGTSRDLAVATVLGNDRITQADHFQDVRHLTLDIDAEYGPADVIFIHPSNRAEHVEALLKHQNWQELADRLISVDKEWARQAGPLVEPLTLRSLFEWHLDLNGIPRRSFFALAGHFAADREKERMLEFGIGDQDALQDLYDYANRPRRSLIETIIEFDTLKIPTEYILDLFPVLRPRQFSIASGANDPKLELTVAIVKYKTILHRIRRGLCTDWLRQLHPGDKIAVKVEPTNTKILKVAEIAHSIICVATGTGIAPIRSLIRTLKGSIPIYLFFGCRFKDKDYLYREEWNEVPNLHLIPAFSREGGSYVQQQIQHNAPLLAPLLAGAMIFVCGAAGKMPTAVREEFVEIGGEELISQKEKQGLYLQETY